MKKNNKGISMVAVVVIIVVILIISGIVIYRGIDAIKIARNQSINTNMLLIQAKARTIEEKVSIEGASILGKKIEDEDILKQISGENNITELEVYSLTQDDLYELDVDVEGDNNYAVDYKNDEVYYLKGIKDKDGNTYYKLSEISKLDLDLVPEQ